MKRAAPLFALLTITLAAAGCELVADIFQAGLIVGLILIVLVVALIIWAIRALIS